jgi:hypothetical protein
MPRINLLFQVPKIPIGKDGAIMLKINFMSTLFVGIDVSSKSNAVYAMDFYKNTYSLLSPTTSLVRRNYPFLLETV